MEDKTLSRCFDSQDVCTMDDFQAISPGFGFFEKFCALRFYCFK